MKSSFFLSLPTLVNTPKIHLRETETDSEEEELVSNRSKKIVVSRVNNTINKTRRKRKKKFEKQIRNALIATLQDVNGRMVYFL